MAPQPLCISPPPRWLECLLPHEELGTHSTPGRSTWRRGSPTQIRSSNGLEIKGEGGFEELRAWVGNERERELGERVA